MYWVFVAAWAFLVEVSGGYSSGNALASCCSGFSCCGTPALGLRVSSCDTDFLALWHVESSRPGFEPIVPSTSRWILNHCPTREVLNLFIKTSRFSRASAFHLLESLLENGKKKKKKANILTSSSHLILFPTHGTESTAFSFPSCLLETGTVSDLPC